ncbi:MAG: hypothetical protein ACKOT0_00775, partial [bacterium]
MRTRPLFVRGVALTGAVLLGALALSAVAGAGTSYGAPPAEPATSSGHLGTNLAAVTYYSGTVPFNDLMRQAGDWVPNADGAPWGEGPPLTLRRDGWPASLARGQVASTVIADVRYPPGRYSVAWSGSGTFTIAGRTFSGRDGRGSVTLDGSSTVVLDSRATDSGDPLRGIRVRVPGAGSGERFR